MFDLLAKLSWVKHGHGKDLDLVVFDCPLAKSGTLH